MGNDVILKTEGYEISFELKRFPDFNTSLDLTVVFSLEPEIGKVQVRSIPMPIYLRDLYELTTYLEQHIANLQKNPDSEAYTFVTMDLQFEMQAFAGEVRSANDGEFTLRFMVNVGKPEGKTSSVYVGGETEVTLENINSFIAAIRQVLTAMSYKYDARRWE
jgi:hypothetical protein